MNILALDTTSERFRIALSGPGGIWDRNLSLGAFPEDVLFKAVDCMLRMRRWKLESLDALVAATGPGRFTGIRIGMTFVSMVSRLLGKPAVGISVLEGLAYQAAASPELTRLSSARLLLCPALPAYREEFFFQLFHQRGKAPGPEPLSGPFWAPAERIALILDPYLKRASAGSPLVFWGPGARAIRELVCPNGASCFSFAFQGKNPSARSLILPAIRRIRSRDWPAFEPLYLKPTRYEKDRIKFPQGEGIRSR